MSDERALLAAICAHPEEDTPRLMYADWLDENAGSMPANRRASARTRADLIRVQCALFRLPPDEEDADTATRRVELELRETELLANASRRKAWARPLNRLRDYSNLVPDSAHFVRGFPHFMPYVQEAAGLIDLGAALFDISPVHVLWCGYLRDGVADRFLAQPWLARARRIEVTTWPVSTEKLFAAPTLANLEELHVNIGEFVAPGSPVEGRALASLRRLELRGHAHRFPATFARLGELLAPEARLREFELTDTRYGADDLATLAAFPRMCNLERLTLGSRYDGASTPPFGVAAVRAITTAPFWKCLRSFRDEMPRYCEFGAAETEELAAAPPTPHLRTLSLSSGNLTGAVAALAASPLLSTVTTLDLSNNTPGDAVAAALAKSPHLGRLLSLKLDSCEVGPDGVKALAEAPFAAHLVRLSLKGASVRRGGVEALVSRDNFPRLRFVDLSSGVTTGALQQLLRARFGTGARL